LGGGEAPQCRRFPRWYRLPRADCYHTLDYALTIYLGTQGWSYKDWVGSFYPAGTAARDFLACYAQQFGAVELDTTFYGTPTPSRVRTWFDVTPDDFLFTAKVPRTITHDRHLVDCREDFEEFVAIMRLLGHKLGPILIQLPPDFTAGERPALEAFLRLLPAEYRFAAEFRHRSWLTEETDELLHQHRVAWTMIDLSFMPQRAVLTTDFTYVRWLGDRRKIVRMNETQLDRTAELDAWAQSLSAIAKEVVHVHGFVNNHYSGHSPADVRYLRRQLGIPTPAGTEHLEQRSLL